MNPKMTKSGDTVELADEAPVSKSIGGSVQEKFVSDLSAIIEHRGAGSVLRMISRAFLTVQMERVARDSGCEEDVEDVMLSHLSTKLETLADKAKDTGKQGKIVPALDYEAPEPETFAQLGAQVFNTIPPKGNK